MSVEPGLLDANILVYAADTGAAQHPASGFRSVPRTDGNGSAEGRLMSSAASNLVNAVRNCRNLLRNDGVSRCDCVEQLT